MHDVLHEKVAKKGITSFRYSEGPVFAQAPDEEFSAISPADEIVPTARNELLRPIKGGLGPCLSRRIIIKLASRRERGTGVCQHHVLVAAPFSRACRKHCAV
jgi:hypothetical protein